MTYPSTLSNMSSLSKLVKLAVLVTALLAPTATARVLDQNKRTPTTSKAEPRSSWPKRGLAADDDIKISGFGPNTQVNWQYNWASDTTNKQSFAEYVPMLWNDASSATSSWDTNVDKWLKSGSGHLLGFNEPDLPAQANMSPSQAATSYKKWITPYSGRAQLGSPAITNAGISWLTQFLDGCSDCKIDFIVTHWYDSATNFAYFQKYINQVCSVANGKPVWITEFAGSGTEAQQAAFLTQAIPWLDSLSCVYRYAYFATADGDSNHEFLNGNGPALSTLGSQYATTAY